MLREEFEMIYREMEIVKPIIEEFYEFIEDVRNDIKKYVPEYYDAQYNKLIIPYLNAILNVMSTNFKTARKDISIILERYAQLPEIRNLNATKKLFPGCKFSVDHKRIRLYYTRGYYESDLNNGKV